MTAAKLFVLLLSTAVIFTASAQRCEAPSSGCTYGMWNYDKCLCECISPFCPDANGDCVVPTGNCGGNPWAGCTRGVNCPWWGSLSNGDVCNTGSAIPAGVWSIYNTREICCGVHAPFSSTCNQKGPNGPVYDPNSNRPSNNLDNSLNEPTISRPQSSYDPVNGGSGESNVNGGSNAGNTAIMSNSNGNNPTNGESGLPGWAVALIVIPLLILFGCIGYCFCVRNNDKEGKGAVNVLFSNPFYAPGSNRKVNASESQNGSAPPRRQRSFVQRGSQALRQSFAKRPNRSSNGRDRPRRRDDGRSRRSSRSRYDSVRSSFTGMSSRVHRPRRSRDDGRSRRRSFDSLRSSFTGMTNRVHRPRRSRGERSRRDPSVSLSKQQDSRFSADEFTVNTYTTKKKSAQDPPMNAMVLYEPNYAKPDPEGETAGAIVLALTNGEDNNKRNVPMEPNMKQKLEPEELDIESAPSQIPDPSVPPFVEPQPVLYGRSVDASDDEDEYDGYGFRLSQPQIYAPKRMNKKEDFEESLSFATQDPEEEEEEEERRWAKKSRKKKNRGSSSHSRKRYAESDSSIEVDKSYMKKDSGVESNSDVGSIDLESRASA